MFVPAGAVQIEEDTNSSQVFVIDEGKARLNVVRAAKRENGRVRITSGLSGGEVVAASGLNQLYDGAPVQTKGNGKLSSRWKAISVRRTEAYWRPFKLPRRRSNSTIFNKRSKTPRPPLPRRKTVKKP